MGFWDRVKEQHSKDIAKAKGAAYTKDIKLEYIGGMPGVKGKEIKFSRNMQTGETKINGKEVQLQGLTGKSQDSGALAKPPPVRLSEPS